MSSRFYHFCSFRRYFCRRYWHSNSINVN